MVCSRPSNVLLLMFVDCSMFVLCKLGSTSLTVLPKSEPSTPQREWTSLTYSKTFWRRSDCQNREVYSTYQNIDTIQNKWSKSVPSIQCANNFLSTIQQFFQFVQKKIVIKSNTRYHEKVTGQTFVFNYSNTNVNLGYSNGSVTCCKMSANRDIRHKLSNNFTQTPPI